MLPKKLPALGSPFTARVTYAVIEELASAWGLGVVDEKLVPVIEAVLIYGAPRAKGPGLLTALAEVRGDEGKMQAVLDRRAEFTQNDVWRNRDFTRYRRLMGIYWRAVAFIPGCPHPDVLTRKLALATWLRDCEAHRHEHYSRIAKEARRSRLKLVGDV